MYCLILHYLYIAKHKKFWDSDRNSGFYYSKQAITTFRSETVKIAFTVSCLKNLVRDLGADIANSIHLLWFNTKYFSPHDLQKCWHVKKMILKVMLCSENVFIHFSVYFFQRNVVSPQWPADINEDFKILEWWDLLKELVNNYSHIINEHSPTHGSDFLETPFWEFCFSECREMAHLILT